VKNLQEILEITLEVGRGAANLLQSYYQGTPLNIQYKQDEPVTEADVAVSDYILGNLQAALGDQEFAYINEETYKAQLGGNTRQWAWIIDPLDGTRDFINKTADYAVHIALVQETRPVLAVVAIPEAGKLYFATKGGGSFVESSGGTTPLQVSSAKKIEDLILVVSRSHRHEQLDYLLEHLPWQNQRAMGSVGCKIAAILEQRADVYISLSGKSAPKDWDLAAPELILTEAGGNFTHFDGSPLHYNTGDINQWGGLLASNSQYHELLCQEAMRVLAVSTTKGFDAGRPPQI